MSKWRRFLCFVLGWHAVNNVCYDVQTSGVCEHCKQRCLMDSNGDWFAVNGS